MIPYIPHLCTSINGLITLYKWYDLYEGGLVLVKEESKLYMLKDKNKADKIESWEVIGKISPDIYTLLKEGAVKFTYYKNKREVNAYGTLILNPGIALGIKEDDILYIKENQESNDVLLYWDINKRKAITLKKTSLYNMVEFIPKEKLLGYEIDFQ
jgi:hypothetical protein